MDDERITIVGTKSEIEKFYFILKHFEENNTENVYVWCN